MHLRIIIIILILCGCCLTATCSKNEQAYEGAMALEIAYDPKGSDMFIVTLTNTSSSKLDLMVNSKEIEGRFFFEGSIDSMEHRYDFIDKDYLGRLVTGTWYSGSYDLKPKKTIRWVVQLDELVFDHDDESPVTGKSLAGKTVFLKMDRLAVFPGPNESCVYVDLVSNSIRIPNIEQAAP